MSTIFTQIIERKIPASIVYEDEQVIAFLDIHPVVDGHLPVVVKEEYEWVQDVPDDLLCHLFLTVKKLIPAMKQGLGCDYVHVSIVGKDVPHVHVHLIPRMTDDHLEGWNTHAYANEEEKNQFAQMITGNL